jgi:hypothetical protein
MPGIVDGCQDVPDAQLTALGQPHGAHWYDRFRVTPRRPAGSQDRAAQEQEDERREAGIELLGLVHHFFLCISRSGDMIVSE